MRVKSIMDTNLGTTTTYFVGAHYEVANGVVTKYYYAGSQRIAMRTNGTLNFLLGDHLGSTSLVTDANGQNLIETRYTAWGEIRYSSGLSPTDYTYTGQFSYTADFGLMFYNARWYDSSLGRFAQADSIIPGGVQGLDKYAYVNNNPIRYTDPSGHKCVPVEECEGYKPGSLANQDPFYVSPEEYAKAVEDGYKASIDRGMEFVNNLRNHKGWWTPYIENKSLNEAWKFILALSYALEGYSFQDPEFLVYLTESIINKGGEFYQSYGVAGLFAYVGGREALFDRNVSESSPAWEKGTGEYLNTWGFDPSDTNPYLPAPQRLLKSAVEPGGIMDQAWPNIINYSGTYGNGGYDYGVSPPLVMDQSKLIWSKKVIGVNPWTQEKGAYFIYVTKK